MAELVELDGKTGESEGLFALVAVLGHDGMELRAAIQGGPADPGSSGNGIEGDLLAVGGRGQCRPFPLGPAARRSPGLGSCHEQVEALDEAAVPCGFFAPTSCFRVGGQRVGIGRAERQ